MVAQVRSNRKSFVPTGIMVRPSGKPGEKAQITGKELVQRGFRAQIEYSKDPCIANYKKLNNVFNYCRAWYGVDNARTWYQAVAKGLEPMNIQPINPAQPPVQFRVGHKDLVTPRIINTPGALTRFESDMKWINDLGIRDANREDDRPGYYDLNQRGSTHVVDEWADEELMWLECGDATQEQVWTREQTEQLMIDYGTEIWLIIATTPKWALLRLEDRVRALVDSIKLIFGNQSGMAGKLASIKKVDADSIEWLSRAIWQLPEIPALMNDLAVRYDDKGEIQPTTRLTYRRMPRRGKKGHVSLRWSYLHNRVIAEDASFTMEPVQAHDPNQVYAAGDDPYESLVTHMTGIRMANTYHQSIERWFDEEGQRSFDPSMGLRDSMHASRKTFADRMKENPIVRALLMEKTSFYAMFADGQPLWKLPVAEFLARYTDRIGRMSLDATTRLILMALWSDRSANAGSTQYAAVKLLLSRVHGNEAARALCRFAKSFLDTHGAEVAAA